MMDEGWKHKYKIGRLGSFPGVWAIYSTKWQHHPTRSMKRISPYFSWKSEAEEWISEKWQIHVDNKLERFLLTKE